MTNRDSFRFCKQCNNLLLMAATKKNSNVTLILFYLYKLTTVRIPHFTFPLYSESTL